ncbi:MAG: hypothetical protein CMH04_11295 [Marinovum sp.]|nr:hypothetical protein [Marinovum sp.]
MTNNNFIKYKSFLRFEDYPATILEHLKTIIVYAFLWPFIKLGYKYYNSGERNYPEWFIYNVYEPFHDRAGDFKNAIFELKYDVLRLPLYLPPVETK